MTSEEVEVKFVFELTGILLELSIYRLSYTAIAIYLYIQARRQDFLPGGAKIVDYTY